MARLSLKLAGYPWDHITPLLTGEVVPEGIDLQYDVHHGLGPVTDDPSCAGGEASLGRFMIDTVARQPAFCRPTDLPDVRVPPSLLSRQARHHHRRPLGA